MGSFEQLKDYRKLTERIRELHAAGFHHFQIADALNREGFTPPRRRGAFTKECIGDLIRRLGLTGELFREDLLEPNEWWIPDLARELGVITVKIHYWVKQGWVHHRRTPSGKHLIVWADRGRDATSTQARGKENLLVRGETPRSGRSQEASRPIKIPRGQCCPRPNVS